ncbi:lipid II:glycine glycyltransferase FemX [Bacillus timonensis]|uniref:lipid II:glycine glycyltransferase FemX n=1 Tax=Bacillus timonensis TaxID=1033734 RepID=UPI000288132E|nr:GNAT family N-acetyltransferase [Bacillus timonensis]
MFEIVETNLRWNNILKSFQMVDSYYSYEYGKLFANIEKGKLLGAYYEENGSKIFYPFIVREIPNIHINAFDIVTPYGYGGPIVEGNPNIIKGFYEHLSDFCSSKNIITETIRFHPLYKNYRYGKDVMDIEYIRKTTAVDLTKPLEEIRLNYTSSNKRNIKKARNNNISCFIAEGTKENVDLFIEMYKETMNRNNANDFYYFGEQYFYEQIKETEISKTLLLFAKRENEVIAGTLVIVGTEFAHYHLGASKTKYLEYRPNNLLFDFMIEVCKSFGSKELHLGGGYQENDGLFKYKTSFTNNHNYDYFIGKKIHNLDKYEDVMEYLKKRYELKDHYFPIYRGKLERKIQNA